MTSVVQQSPQLGTPNQRKRKFVYVTRSRSRSEFSAEELADRELVSTALDYSIDPYDFDDNQLLKMVLVFFRYYNLFEEFRLDEDVVLNFFRLVRDMYDPNNYFHNFKHAWGVMHMCFHIMKNGGEKFLDRFDVLSILVAAICHDVCHPGNSNAFEMATKTNVSKRFAKKDEICVLERYHARVTQRLLMADNIEAHDLLVSFTASEKERFMQQVDFIIMGTDMAKHQTLVEEARAFANSIGAIGPSSPEIIANVSSLDCKSSSSNASQNSQNGPNSAEKLKRGLKNHGRSKSLRIPEVIPEAVLMEDVARSPVSDVGSTPSASPHFQHRLGACLLPSDSRMRLTRVLVHSADIGAQTQAQQVALKWMDRVYAEYRLQAERELSLGIMTSPFIHDLKEDTKVFSTQFSFINDIVEPIWSAVVEFTPELKFALHQLVANKLHYRQFFTPQSQSS